MKTRNLLLASAGLMAVGVFAFVAFGAQQTINVGSTNNDGTGDPLRVAFQKANSNFTDIYTGSGVTNMPATALTGVVAVAHGGTGNTNGPGSVPCTLWVSATGGNNSTASRGTLLPFQTIRAAVNASQPGDLIYVLPGLYSENNLLTNGVNYYFEAGATDSYMQILTNEYLGIFDDRSCGPTTNIIGGYGAFVFLGCTNFITFGNFGGPAPAPNPALRGAITISNSATQLEFHAASLGAATGMQNNGFCAVASLLGRSDLFITQIYNPYGTTGTITVTNTHGNPPTNQGTTTFSPSCQSAIYWELGNCYYHGDTIEQLGNPNGAGYAIWENEPSAGHTNALFVDLNEIHNKVYIVSYSTEYTSWLNIKRVDCSTNISGESCVDFSVYGAGKHYIVSDKINSGPGGECIELQPQLGVSNSQVWLNAQKLTGGIGWVYNNGGGTLRAQVIDYDDAQGQIVDGFSLNPGGVNYIEGGLGWVSNGIGIFTTGGTNFFDNLALDTSNGGQTNNWPVLLDGGSNYVNGCRFNCPASTYSIMSSNSVTVPLLSSFVHGGASPTVTTTTNY